MGASITTTGSTVTLALSGAAPSGGVAFEIPAFVNHIASASAGTVDNANGVVTLSAGATGGTVTLTTMPTYQQLGGLDLNGYCTSIGDIGGVSLDGIRGRGDRVPSFGFKTASPLPTSSGRYRSRSLPDADAPLAWLEERRRGSRATDDSQPKCSTGTIECARIEGHLLDSDHLVSVRD